ncbi:hypothetical protein [Pseudoxanthomonas sp. UC19_8]|uniref:hypothetical protein n=1 Tax=Pseudoxanthomonas sp. UC19_8 TaxID=3350175 RepID=UPI0036D4363D
MWPVSRVFERAKLRHAKREALTARRLRSAAQAGADEEAHRLWMAAAQCRRVLERLRHRVGAWDPDGRLLEQARRLALFELDAERAIAALRMQVLQGTHSIDEQRARSVTARDHLETAADELELRANLVDARQQARQLRKHSEVLLSESRQHLLAICAPQEM